jgi:hypothetical protein
MSGRAWIVTAGVVTLLGVGLAAEIIATRPVRQSLTAYTALLVAANRQDVPAVCGLCSARYLQTHSPRPAPEGGIVGLPRNIHPNHRAWRHGDAVWICPTNRVGPIYQFVPEGGAWKFDGPAGILRGRGEVITGLDLSELESPPPSPPARGDSTEPPGPNATDGVASGSTGRVP